jgi:ACT domain-containing protein
MIEIEMLASALDGLQIVENPELLAQEPMLTPADITAKEHILETMKNTIERMNKTQHVEVLKIFKKFPQIKLNENRNGVYINLSYLPQDSIHELSRYIDYVEAQETNLETMEARKEEYKSFFSN